MRFYTTWFATWLEPWSTWALGADHRSGPPRCWRRASARGRPRRSLRAAFTCRESSTIARLICPLERVWTWREERDADPDQVLRLDAAPGCGCGLRTGGRCRGIRVLRAQSAPCAAAATGPDGGRTCALGHAGAAVRESGARPGATGAGRGAACPAAVSR